MARLKQIIPEKTFTDQVLVPGGAFRIPYTGKDGKEKTRYFFVLNANPKKDKIILLVTPTTQIAKAQKRGSKGHLLYFGANKYPEMKKRSVVECNSPLHKFTKSRIIKGLRKNRGAVLPPLPEKLFSTLKAKILTAAIHTEEEKKLIAM